MVKLNQQSGLTIFEIMIAVAILVILSALAITNYGPAVEKGRAGEAVSVMTAIRAAQERYNLEFDAYATDISDLDVQVTATQFFNAPTTDGAAITMVRSNGSYTLAMTMAGVISCTDGGSNVCEQLGY